MLVLRLLETRVCLLRESLRCAEETVVILRRDEVARADTPTGDLPDTDVPCATGCDAELVPLGVS